MRIGFVGGTSLVEAELESFLLALHQKYPDAIIVTGNGRGAEQIVKRQMEAWSHKVELPPLRRNLYSDPLSCQINDILIASDIIVTVGAPSGSRAKIATDIHRRVDMLYETWSKKYVMRELGRPLHNVAAPQATPKKRAARPTKRKELLAA